MTPLAILGIIPARGGSKGIPRKNLTLLGGQTLLARACTSARESRLSWLVVSTDDEAIAEVARSCGVEVPALRPAKLAADDTPMVDVAWHEVQEHRRRTGQMPDAVMILQPTSPFRTRAHIDDAIATMERTDADTVVSVQRVPHHFLPEKLMRLEHDDLVFLSSSPLLQRQEVPVLYARNGPLVLLTRTAVLDGGTLYGRRIQPLFMTTLESIDIDTEEDICLASAILAERGARG